MDYGLMFESCEGEGLAVCGCEPLVREIVIPSSFNGINVVGIAPYAFENNTKITSVRFDGFEVPESFEQGEEMPTGFTIGEQAFAGCTSLLHVELPENLISIERGAFYGCKKLDIGQIPEACFIGEYAFYGCESIKELEPIDCIPEGVFSHCKSLRNLPVSEWASEIGEDAFYHCYGLVDIEIPARVRKIGALAFRSCYGLKRVTFADPDGWVWYNGYTDREYPLDLSDPRKNAEMLRTMDFDDGVLYWKKRV